MTQLADDLAKARELVAAGWCQGNTAINATGAPVNASSPEVARVCAMGAMDRAGDWANDPKRTSAMAEALYGVLNNDSIVDWNDAPERTQAEVLAAFDKAIAAARGAK